MSESFDFLVGEPVNQIWVWGPIRLVIESERLSGNGDLLRVAFTDPSGQRVEIDATKRPTEAGPLLAPLRKCVTSAESTGGVLVIRFDDGSELRGYPDERYESWSVGREGSPTFTCLPGGEVTSW